MKPIFATLLVLAAFCGTLFNLPGVAIADQPAVYGAVTVTRNVFYTPDNDPNRSMDIYVPTVAPKRPLPLVILIHGGGWAAGDKGDFGGPAADLVLRGYAAVSINYRLSQQAIWPAQAIDCKSAVRWLRAHAAQYGFDPKRFAVGGHSAGGHLSAFVAASNGVRKFDQGENLDVSSDVQAELWFSGVGNLVSRATARGYEGEQDPHSGESMLIGGAVLLNKDKAMDASPVTWVSKKTPPFYFEVGTRDGVVPPAQADEMAAVLKTFGIYSEFNVLQGSDHGGPEYFDIDQMNKIDRFLHRALKLRPVDANAIPSLTSGTFTLSSLSASQLVLTGDGAGTSDGTKVTIENPTGAISQQWSFVRNANGFYSIHPAYAPTLAVTVVGAGTVNKTWVILSPDTAADSQLWTPFYSAVGDFWLFAPKCAPALVLENFDGRQTAGSQVDIWGYDGGNWHMQWRLTPTVGNK
jgi:acetyl esterase/lipase